MPPGDRAAADGIRSDRQARSWTAAEPGRTDSEVTRHQDPPNPQGESDQIPNLSVRHSLRAAGQRRDRPQPSSERTQAASIRDQGIPATGLTPPHLETYEVTMNA